MFAASKAVVMEVVGKCIESAIQQSLGEARQGVPTEEDLHQLLEDVGYRKLEIKYALIFPTHEPNAAAVALVAQHLADNTEEAFIQLEKTCLELLYTDSKLDSHQHTDLLLREAKSCSPERFLRLTYPKGSMVGGVFEWPLTSQALELLKACIQRKEVFPILGVHPRQACKITKEELTELVAYFNNNRGSLAAVGETGICDKWRGKGVDVRSQKALFKIHVLIAKATKLPLVLHLRSLHGEQENSVDIALDVLKDARLPQDHPINIHAWGDTSLHADKFKNYFTNTYFGFGSLLHRPHVEEIAKSVCLSKVLIETDAPHMGQSDQAKHYLSTLARQRKIDTLELSKKVRSNMKAFFSPVPIDQLDFTEALQEIKEWSVPQTVLDVEVAGRMLQQSSRK